jgi:Glycosyltransferases involved in cell wall biogenesis
MTSETVFLAPLNEVKSRDPLISVITICKNAGSFIEQCIQSVLSQDFDDYEYVIIDGGSTDGTVDLIRKYQDQLSYWHSKQDRGLAHAFNLGVEHSRGQWLLFLNSDDFFVSSSVLSDISGVLQGNPEADVVFGQIQLVSRETRAEPLKAPMGMDFKWNSYLLRDTIPHPAAFTSRDLFRRIGLFSEDFRIAVDYEHYLRAGRGLHAIHEPVLVSCMREGGMSKRNRLAALREWRKAHLVNNTLSGILVRILYIMLVSHMFVKQIWAGYVGNRVKLTPE